MKAELRKLIDEKRNSAYTPEYRDKTPDSKVLGMILSSALEWDGIAILEAAGEALEDANFHDEAAAVRGMIEH